MKLLDVCKSGFYDKLEKPQLVDVLRPIINVKKLYNITVRPTNDGKNTVIMQIKVPFSQIFPRLSEIIVHCYSFPKLNYIEFSNVKRNDLHLIMSKNMRSYKLIPFEIEEICFYLANYTWDVYIYFEQENPSRDVYRIRGEWTGIFQKLFQTDSVNVVLLK